MNAGQGERVACQKMRRIQRARSAITCGGYASRRNDEEEEEERDRERETDGEREWDRTRDGMKRGCYTSVFRARARARVCVYV